MSDRIERDVVLPASPQRVWDAITADGWLADQVMFDLRPGGEASFASDEGIKRGWVEEASAPRRLTFWWSADEEPATRVEITITPGRPGTRLRIVETRPLELLDLVGTPLWDLGGRRFGPAMVGG
jgi:uncharacterized protein YndB with AHSA1/START domain